MSITQMPTVAAWRSGKLSFRLAADAVSDIANIDNAKVCLFIWTKSMFDFLRA